MLENTVPRDTSDNNSMEEDQSRQWYNEKTTITRDVIFKLFKSTLFYGWQVYVKRIKNITTAPLST